MVDLRPDHLELVKRILAGHVPEYEVHAFGSRVRWTAKETSDLDLVVMTDAPLDLARLADLQEAFSESDLPFRVDVLDWAAIAEDFRRIIEQEYVVIQPGSISSSRPTWRRSGMMGDLPSTWRLMPLLDCMAAIIDYRGKTPRKTSAGIPLITAKIVKNGRIETPEEFIDPTEYEEWMRRGLPERGDVLVTTEAPLGEVAQLRDANVALAQRLITLRGKPGLLDNTFLKFLMQSAFVQEQLKARSSGTTVLGIKQSELRQVSLIVPEIIEQQAIACILGALDDKIELNQRMNDTLEAMARAMFKSWFVDFDPVRAKAAGQPPSGLAPHVADLFPDEFEESELGEIPKGWIRTSLKRLFPLDPNCVITGPFGSNLHASDYREEGVPLLLVKNVVNGAIVEDGVPLVGWHKVSELERYRLKLGDIIFTRVGAVGRSAYIYPRYVGWMISGQTLRVSISDWTRLHPRYLASVFQYPAFIAMVESHALGTTRPSLNTSILESFEFLYPPPELQLEYARIIAALDERRLANLEQIGTLAALRDTLLPRLISGELRVPDAEKFVGAVV